MNTTKGDVVGWRRKPQMEEEVEKGSIDEGGCGEGRHR